MVSSLLVATATPTVLVIGDSYSDTGAGYVDTDETTAIDYATRRFGARLTVPRAARPGSSVNFAISGAASGRDRRRVLGAWWADGGVRQAVRAAGLVRRGRIVLRPWSLAFLATGLNDRDVPTEQTLTNIALQARTLAAVGIADIRVALLPTFPGAGPVGARLNPRLPDLVRRLRRRGIVARLSRWGEFFDQVYEHSADFGIRDRITPARERRLPRAASGSERPVTHFFFHEGHPSSAVHRAVGEMLADEIRPNRWSAS